MLLVRKGVLYYVGLVVFCLGRQRAGKSVRAIMRMADIEQYECAEAAGRWRIEARTET